MSAENDFRQILTGGEQANQADVWDSMDGSSDPVEGRVASSGQTWAVIAGGTNCIQVAGGEMKYKAGSEAVTVYPYLVSPTDLKTIGANVRFVSAGGVTTSTAAVLIIAGSTDLTNGPFLHFVFNGNGQFQLDWFAAGLAGGITATTGLLGGGTVQQSQTYAIEGVISANGATSTVTFITPLGVGQLTGLTLPAGMRTAIWEFASGVSPIIVPEYIRVWANPLSALMLGTTVQPHSFILDKLSGGYSVALPNIVLTTPRIGGNGTQLATVACGTATLVAGTVTVNNTNAWSGSMIWVNRRTDGGTIGCSYTVSTVDFTSLTITSKTSAGATQNLDTSVVSWLLINL